MMMMCGVRGGRGDGVELVIRGASSATKASGWVVQVTPEGASGNITWTLKDMITNDVIPLKAGASSPSVNVVQQFNMGDYYDTPKSGAYYLKATVGGAVSNELMVKILL
eukprot:TRINITY_DN1207_c0_g1_i3.p1 TRINITY_DN1207_c0_g1~~TRINITY_DN1207_c0_g1_i3.p1  ORF type:complete len:109 (+),score=45.07 TRINITY_DN1207_c0_g1_i3:443-769(+)